MKLPIIILLLLHFQYSCNSSKVGPTESKNPKVLSSDEIFDIFERKVMGFSPMSKGPTAVIKYLEELEGFERSNDFTRSLRDKLYNLSNKWSVRFIANEAKIYGKKLFNDKSLFLLNYNVKKDTYDGWTSFHVIYWFENEDDKNSLYDRIFTTLNDELMLEKKRKSDNDGNYYERYYLPNASQFNFKHGSKNNKHFIDILWVPEVR